MSLLQNQKTPQTTHNLLCRKQILIQYVVLMITKNRVLQQALMNIFILFFEQLPSIFACWDIPVPDGQKENWKDRFLAEVKKRNLTKVN